jgi:hypothetical protein
MINCKHCIARGTGCHSTNLPFQQYLKWYFSRFGIIILVERMGRLP